MFRAFKQAHSSWQYLYACTLFVMLRVHLRLERRGQSATYLLPLPGATGSNTITVESASPSTRHYEWYEVQQGRTDSHMFRFRSPSPNARHDAVMQVNIPCIMMRVK